METKLALFVNQIGYDLNKSKFAYATGLNGGEKFELCSKTDGTVVFKGQAKQPVTDRLAGEPVCCLDFSDFKKEGTYFIHVTSRDGKSAQSEPVHVGTGLFSDFYYSILYYYYLSRCGCDTQNKQAGKWGHSACHTSPAVIYGTSIKKEVNGGWHDAGDYGRYIVAASKAVMDLLMAYEAGNCERSAATRHCERSAAISFDILSEVRFELEWMLKMQREDGGVFHKVSCYHFCGFINPQDEIMRSAMENEIRNTLSLEDKRRASYAKYHIDNARQYASRYDGSGAVYEYQRALLLDPMNYEARAAYADILEINGMYELYLEQLKFIKEHSYDSLTKRQKTSLDDKIEAFDSLLVDNLGLKWKVEPFYLDKTRWNIAVFYEESNNSYIHADTNRLVANAAADIFSGVAITSVKTQVTPVSGYGEAFKNARAGGFDYFIILSLSEGENDMTLNSTMYSGRTGLEITKNSFYCTGNNRFSTVLRRFRNSILEKLSVRGRILARNGKTVLVDLGKSENIVADSVFKIIKKGQIRTADSGTGLYYRDDDVLGTLVITVPGEEISEATIENHGFYDRINVDDEIVLVSMPEAKTNNDANGNAIDNVPAADERGNAVVKNEVKGSELVDEIKKAVERPSILDLLRNIY